MKNKQLLSFLAKAAQLALLVLFPLSCDFSKEAPEGGTGCLSLSLGGGVFTKSDVNTKALPDSSKFILEIRSSDDETVYKGTYGDAPSYFMVPSGVYTISIRSGAWKKPGFDDPVYGDDQIVHISAGSNINVLLVCTLMNCGVKLLIDKSFPERIQDAALVLRGADGSLPYGSAESRIAYFKPGDISLVLSKGAEDKVLTTRSLDAREVLRLKVFASPYSGAGIGVQVDTTVVWIDDSYTIGEDGGAMDVAKGREAVGQTGVWVYGYIVGNASPFLGESSSTNLAISGKTSASSKDECMSVELKKGPLRDALNIVQNASNKGRKLFLKGDVIQYYGMPGIKNITDWSLDAPPSKYQ
ncbi:MAG: DUF4493 domain-containing protein [Bacteroidales bacterium]|nr:DUF4493 domain-containing protein [Bacteroidales bacterium]